MAKDQQHARRPLEEARTSIQDRNVWDKLWWCWLCLRVDGIDVQIIKIEIKWKYNFWWIIIQIISVCLWWFCESTERSTEEIRI